MCVTACPTGCQYCTTDPSSGNPVCQFGQCKISYYMKSDRSCAACPSGCATCTLKKTDYATVVCTACLYGYVLNPSGGICVRK
jgi:hypothetical protein